METSVAEPNSKKKTMETNTWHKGEQIQKKRIRQRVDITRHLAFYDKGPGAAGYILPPLLGKKFHALSHVTAPEYTMRPFLQSSFLVHGLTGPGTAYYKIPHQVTHHGKLYPLEQSFGGKFDTSTGRIPVGPASHNLPPMDVYLFRTRKCIVLPDRPSVHKNYSDAIYEHGPMIGPNIATRNAAQAVSMKGDRKERKSVDHMSPGVGRYNIKEPVRNPAWTMAGRHRQSQDLTDGVGPKYSLEHIKNYPRSPTWKMGEKPSNFTGILRIPCDVVDYTNLDRLN